MQSNSPAMRSPLLGGMVNFDSLKRAINRIPPALRLITPSSLKPGEEKSRSECSSPEVGPGDDTIIDADETGPLLMFPANADQDDPDQSFAQYTTETFRPKRIMTRTPSPVSKSLRPNDALMNVSSAPPSLYLSPSKLQFMLPDFTTFPYTPTEGETSGFAVSSVPSELGSRSRDSGGDFFGANVLSKSMGNSPVNERFHFDDNTMLFHGSVFAIEGFPSVTILFLQDLLLDHGAVVVNLGKSPLQSNAPDISQCYLMLPMACPVLPLFNDIHTKELRSGLLRFVTDNWVHSCIESNSLLDPSSSTFFVPNLITVVPYLEHINVAVTRFSDQERRNLVQALTALGAPPTQSTFRSTSDVLVSAEYDEEDTKRAYAWGARITSKAWVEAMVKSGEYELPRDFPLTRPPLPLAGVIIFATETLDANADLYCLALSLGARMLPTFSPRCTHILHVGDTELDIDRSQRAHIVSPWWLRMTSKSNKRLPESSYPPTYSPDEP